MIEPYPCTALRSTHLTRFSCTARPCVSSTLLLVCSAVQCISRVSGSVLTLAGGAFDSEICVTPSFALA
eukprot:407421-Prymnesium_polylepis.1